MNVRQFQDAIEIAVAVAVDCQRGATESEREASRAWHFALSLNQALQKVDPALAKKLDLVIAPSR